MHGKWLRSTANRIVLGTLKPKDPLVLTSSNQVRRTTYSPNRHDKILSKEKASSKEQFLNPASISA